MKPEYHEGPEALDKFNKTVTSLFRVSKSEIKPMPVRKPKKTSKD